MSNCSGDGRFAFRQIVLNVKANVPGISETRFSEIANIAKAGWPVSMTLATNPILLNAVLVG